MNAPLRVAIVGAGLMGRWHAYYAARAGAEIAAIVDEDAHAARTLGRRYSRVTTFANLEACLSHSRITVAHICTPTASHVALATAALNAGAHVLLEKPV